ncbi:sulfatase-like hydrolase/transferase [Pontibacter beigongshangensis]|uniref:sulfatase-like hydrolase/transferase n=1 Tax=Pontibacter beigongshangensis TaxID=2574733 RepID=UPI00164F9467|nr:sulfatase-like hydrolase/transferase [Pontibacter beigongshangensis]
MRSLVSQLKNIRFNNLACLLNGIGLVLVGAFIHACTSPMSETDSLQTENVVIIVIDGPRYSETWANIPGLIPNMSGKMKQDGVFLNHFYNDGYTYTSSGHAVITTGVNQPIDNYGDELPANPSIFQYWLKNTGKPTTAAWIISSKDKLHILANTSDPEWNGKFIPSIDCGIAGPGTGYRADSLTMLQAKQILTTHKPSLVLINFMEPDGFAHAGNWDYYLRGIGRSDRFVKELWGFLQGDSFYRNSTALIVTNDHGRHLNEINGGWVDHGDNCEGCEHISLLALGPDFKKGKEVEARYTLKDIAPTVARLLKFEIDSVVIVPRLDTIVVASQKEPVGLAVKTDSVQVAIVLDTTVLQGHPIRELFIDTKLNYVAK